MMSMQKRSVIALILALMCAFCPAALAQESEVLIELKDGATAVTAEGVKVEGDVITITKAGEYTLSGALSNGQIVVEVGNDDKVQLNLKGVTISCDFSAPIYIVNADKVEIKLISDTKNVLTDVMRETKANDKSPTACLFSKDDMIIKGTGELTINAGHNNGIGCKNDLRISGGVINVTAVNNALKGNDSVEIRGGRITVLLCQDGIKAEEELREDKGFVSINGATISLSCSDDAIQAPRAVTITNSTITTHVGDQAINCPGTVSVQDGCLTEE